MKDKYVDKEIKEMKKYFEKKLEEGKEILELYKERINIFETWLKILTILEQENKNGG